MRPAGNPATASRSVANPGEGAIVDEGRKWQALPSETAFRDGGASAALDGMAAKHRCAVDFARHWTAWAWAGLLLLGGYIAFGNILQFLDRHFGLLVGLSWLVTVCPI